MKRMFLLITAMLVFAWIGAQAETLTLPGSLTTIGEEAFAGDRSLNAVVFSGKVKIIGTRAFANCALKAVDLPASVTTIEREAFAGNINLES